MHDPVDVLVRVEPDMGRHDREYRCAPEPSVWMPTLLPFRSLMRADGLVREQLVAAGVHTRQHRDRLAGIQVRDERCRGAEAEVDLAACDHLRYAEAAG